MAPPVAPPRHRALALFVLLAMACASSPDAPDAAQLDAAQPDAAQPDTAQPDAARPDDVDRPVDVAPVDAAEATLRARVLARAEAFVGNGTVEIAPTGTPEPAPQLPTLVFGVVSDELTEVFTLARDDEGAPPRARSVYPISSISKLVTGLIAARGVVAGDFTADTRARELLAPDLASAVGDRTVLELVTHTAGYNPNPMNWTGPPESPAAGYSRAQLAACLAIPACSTARAVRGRYLYSNLSVGILGLALADRYATTFEQLVTERLTRDLGMLDTHTRALADEARFVGGHTLQGAAVSPATMGALASAGELLSTGEDMQRLTAALVSPPAALAPAVTLAATPSTASAQVGFAIDVISRRGLDLRAKSGEQAGYSSMVMWCPAMRAGAFALANLGHSSRTLAALLIELHVMLRDARR